MPFFFMKRNVLRYAENGNDDQRVRDFFNSIDQDFYPPISQRQGKLDRYLEKPTNQGKIALFEREGTLVGALAYWIEKGVATAEIVGVKNQFRKTPVLYRLLEYAIQNEAEETPVETVRADTWKTNLDQRSVLETLGFEVEELVEGDIIPNRTTVKYGAKFRDICDFFGLD